MPWVEASYAGLLLLSFLAATVLPLSSEALLLLMLGGDFDPLWTVAVASVGNVAGGATNYGLGRLGDPRWLRRLRISEARLVSLEGRVKRYGAWAAWLGWVPFVGDPILVALGFFRARWWSVFAAMAAGKVARYLVLAAPWWIG